MHLILERLTGATFQTELLVMTLLGLANCTLNWSPFDWTTQAEKIKKMPMTSQYSDEIKTVLRWVVIARIIIDHMYFVSYLGNLYSVFTWCRPKLLLPWMIISASKNFLLEFIPFVITLMLYMEGNFPTILFVEFIVESVITFATAAYYWCGIKKLFVELSQIQRRKLTRANLIAQSDANSARIGAIFTNDFTNKRKNFMSLTNFTELSFHSALDFDGDREQYRFTKSLTTLTSMDSQASVEPDEDLNPIIIDSTSPTPAEKALKILGMNQDDVNDARIRLGKSVLTNTSKVKVLNNEITKIHATALPISRRNITDEVLMDEESLTERNTDPKDKGQSNMNSQKIIEMSSTQSPLTYSADDRNTSQDLFTETSRNLPKRCTCAKSNIVSVNVNAHNNMKNSLIEIPGKDREHEEDDDDSNAEQDLRQTGILLTTPSKKSVNVKVKSFGPSVFWSVNFPRLDSRQKDADFLNWSCDEDTKNSDAPTFSSHQMNRAFQSLTASSFDNENVGCLHNTSEHLRRVSVELYRANKISLEQRHWNKDNTDVSRNEIPHGSFEDSTSNQHALFRVNDTFSVSNQQVEENSKNGCSVRNSLEVDIQTDVDDSDEQRRIEQDVESLPNTSRTSMYTQTNISHIWKKTLTSLKRPLEASIHRHTSKTQDVFKSNSQDFPTHRKKMLLSGITRFTKIRKRPEETEEREAREMRALRAYNRLTLLEDKREMEMMKGNSAFRNRTGLQSLISNANLVNIAASSMQDVSKVKLNQSFENENVQIKLDQLLKRQTRSRPQEKTSKLSTFNLGLDALENSISMSFSSENKNRSKLHYAKNNFNHISPNSEQDGRKQLSKYSKPMRIFDKTNVSSPSTARTEGLQTGRDLDRTRGVENITHTNTNREVDDNIEPFNQSRLQEILSGTILSSLESLQTQQPNPLVIDEFNDIMEYRDKHGISNLKKAIKNLDWGFNDNTSYRSDVVQRENCATGNENVLYDIIDDTDTISLLQSAFASNPENTERGFYLGPGSTELYSLSNFLGNVVQEIMKTARIRPNPDDFTTESTTEVDYGDCYLQEFEITILLTVENSDDETSSESNSKEEVASMINEQLVPSKPVEMCWSSYSSEGIDTRANDQLSIIVTDKVDEITEEDYIDSESYQDRLRLQYLNGSKSLGKLLGEREISYVEYWTKELKDLALNDRVNDFEFTKEFRHLTMLPGFCVVKLLVDFFRDFVTRSTMTSRVFLGTNTASTSSSIRSEEFISGYFNQLSNASITNETPNILSNFESVQVIENDVSDSLQELMDRLTENTDTSDPPNDQIYEIHDGRSIFPLREDQFYFGTPGNTRRLIKENLSSVPEAQSDEATSNLQNNLTNLDRMDRESMQEEIDTFEVIKRSSSKAHAPITFYIFGATSISQDPSDAHNKGTVLHQNTKAPLKIEPTADSFDSLYSADVGRNFKSSINVISIGSGSSLEEFPEDTLIARSSIESSNTEPIDPVDSEINNQFENRFVQK